MTDQLIASLVPRNRGQDRRKEKGTGERKKEEKRRQGVGEEK